MDNPQQYQPLSHALNPPIVQPQYEEEDEEEEGDDEGAVEEQLERDDDDGDDRVGCVPRFCLRTSPPISVSAAAQTVHLIRHRAL